MSGSIRLSEKHGVNPMLLKCAICGNDAGLALLGRLPGDAEAPREGSDGRTLCNDCEGVLKQGGGMLIEVRDGEKGQDPFRTGQVWGLKKEAFDRISPDPSQRVAYIEEKAAKMLGLPKAVKS